MPAGRPRKPTALRAREGNRGRRPLPPDEPQVPVLALDDPMPDPPSTLSEAGRVHWFGEIGTSVHGMGVLTDVDLTALGILCEIYAEWVKLGNMIRSGGLTMEHINIKGETVLKTRPEVARHEWATQALGVYLGKFGLSPADRARVSVVKKKPTQAQAAAAQAGAAPTGTSKLAAPGKRLHPREKVLDFFGHAG